MTTQTKSELSEYDIYNVQSRNFLESTGTDIKIEYFDYNYHFEGDKDKRDIYSVVLKRGNREYAFKFGQSLANTHKKEPSEYDILTCLTTYDPGTFEEFCWDYGYSDDSIKALNIYNKVVDEFKSLCNLYSDAELSMLGEIV